MTRLFRHHGTHNTYSQGCRCVPCREAHRLYMQDIRSRRAGTLPAGDPRHGTRNGFDHYGCRCGDCSQVQQQSSRDYYQRTAPPKRPAVPVAVAKRIRAWAVKAGIPVLSVGRLPHRVIDAYRAATDGGSP